MNRKQSAMIFSGTRLLFSLAIAIVSITGCKQDEQNTVKKIKQMDPAKAAVLAANVQSVVKPGLADSNLSISLWGVDSLVVSPIAIDIDDNGDVYYVTTNRQKIPNLIYVPTRTGKYLLYNCRPSKTKGHSCIRNCRLKTARRTPG